MKVYRSVAEIIGKKNFIATIGTFDGVHLGHTIVLNRLMDKAKSEAAESLVITFHPHPRLVLNQNDQALNLITTLDEKLQLLENIGIQHVLLQPFTFKFSQMSGKEFIDNFLIEGLNIKHLMIGYDHHFGKREATKIENIQDLLLNSRLNFTLIEKQEIDQISVSSTKIRKALKDGDIEIANLYLGYNFSMKGVVVHGNKLGRVLGFPTANIMLNDSLKIIPSDGVYAVRLNRDSKTCFGMMNIGKKPTIDGANHSIEVNIFGLNEEIYGEELTLEFVRKIRNEVKFASLDELKNQIEKDKFVVEKIFNLR